MNEAPVRSCGACTLCCKNTTIPELEKPYGRWCRACKIGEGCREYVSRPETCRAFSCLWLTQPSLPEMLRPDRCGVILCRRQHSMHGRVIVALVDRGQLDRVTHKRLRGPFTVLQRRGFKIFVSDDRQHRQLLEDGTLVRMAPG